MKTNKDVIYHSSSTKLLCERKTQQVSTSPPAPDEPGPRQFTLQSLSRYKDISNTPPCPSPKCRVTGRSKCSILILLGVHVHLSDWSFNSKKNTENVQFYCSSVEFIRVKHRVHNNNSYDTVTCNEYFLYIVFTEIIERHNHKMKFASTCFLSLSLTHTPHSYPMHTCQFIKQIQCKL